jgi:hypothetical protein
MRVAKMGYRERVTKKDKQGRITSSWLRVRVVVPDGLPSLLPPPHSGKRSLTKKVHTDREHAEWTARFLAMIEGAREWTTIHRDLAASDRMSLEEMIGRRPPPVFAKLEQWQCKIFGKPAWMTPAEPVPFGSMIPKWAKHNGKGKKAVQDMTTKCGKFIAWLEHDNMAAVTFEHGRDCRDDMIEDGDLSSRASATI